jgi:hypothetical protein
MSATTDIAQHWSARLKEFLPEFMGSHDALRAVRKCAALVMHGSTCRGIDDAFSDLDIYMALSDEDLAKLDTLSDTRFFGFELDGKAGHINAWSVSDVENRVRSCEMPVIRELRDGITLADPEGSGIRLVEEARHPMSDAVRRAWACYHYVEMRSDHRGLDNPIERNQPVAVLLFLSKVLGHALRTAMVLDGEPYPYDKWLHPMAVATPTGARLKDDVQIILDLLADDILRLGGPEGENPIALSIRRIRATLIEAAMGSGIDERWLTKWWLHMDQARDGIAKVRW